MKYKAKVKWNGNHYSAGEDVSGSKVEHRANDEVWLFDDEPIPEFPFYGEGREEWVEIDPETLEEVDDLPYLDSPPENYIVNKEVCTMVGRPTREYKLDCTCKECNKDFEMIRTFKPDMRPKPKARFRYVYNISTCPHCDCRLHISK